MAIHTEIREMTDIYDKTIESGYTDSTIMVLKVFLPKWIILE